MKGNDAAWLDETGVAANDVDAGASYLYVPGQLLVEADDADEVRADLERRGLLGDGGSTAPATSARAAFGPLTMRRLGRLLGRERLADLLRSHQQVVEPAEEPVPGQDPEADAVLEEVGLVRLRLDPAADVPTLVTRYRAEGWRVAPNHVLHWEPFWRGGPGDVPEPAKPLDPPAKAEGGPRVAILDTGIQSGWEQDDWFAHRVDGAGASDTEVLDVDGDDVLDVQAGHGTFIASLVATGCPSATIVPRRVLNSFGLASDVELMTAILEIAKTDPDILVLSLGCYSADDRPPPAVTAALRCLPARTVVVAAAGNASQTRVFWPAALKTVVAVGAHDGGTPSGRARFSNHGWWVDACADGLEVHAKFVHFDGGVQGVMEPGDFAGWATWSGTSFSTPIVAGVLAQHMVDHGVSAHDAVQACVRAPGLPALVDLGVRLD
jgi:hypothetical protein